MYTCLCVDIVIYISLKAILSISFQLSRIAEQGKQGGTLVHIQLVDHCSTVHNHRTLHSHSTVHNHTPIHLLLVAKHTVVAQTCLVQTLVLITQVQDQLNLALHQTANHNWKMLMTMHMPQDTL